MAKQHSLSIIDQVSKQLIADLGIKLELKENEQVVFRHVAAGVKSVVVENPVTPSGHHFPGNDMIRDPYSKNISKMVNIILITAFQNRRVAGQPSFQEATQPNGEYIRFSDTGVIHCNNREMEKYWWMMLTNRRRDNPNRTASAKVTFFMFDEKHDAFKEVLDLKYLRMALDELEKLESIDLLKVSKRLNNFGGERKYFIDLNKEEILIQQLLGKIAKEDPRAFLISLKSDRINTRMMIDLELIDKNIMFDEGKRIFFWKGTTAKTGQICKVEPGNKPNEALIDWALLDTDESKAFMKLLKEHDAKNTRIATQVTA